MAAPILIVKSGSTHPDIVRTDGDYDAWFRRSLPDGASRCTVVSAYLGESLPDPRAFGGVILTGSPASVRDEAPWMAMLGRWALAADERGVPVLGVCFGHQLLGEALGGRVERHPQGFERGSITVTLTDEGRADPLFAEVSQEPEFLAVHEDQLVELPPGATLLAGNAHSPVQAFRAGRQLRGVQFHPEFEADVIARLFAARGVTAEKLRASVDGPAVLRAWDRAFVDRGG